MNNRTLRVEERQVGHEHSAKHTLYAAHPFEYPWSLLLFTEERPTFWNDLLHRRQQMPCCQMRIAKCHAQRAAPHARNKEWGSVHRTVRVLLVETLKAQSIYEGLGSL